jgi:hypothetical protein
MHVVNMGEQTTGPLAGRLTAHLAAWPAMTASTAECGVGVGFTTVTPRSGIQVVHLHGGDEADLYLTRPVVTRLGEALRQSGRILIMPNQDWIRIHLDTESDVELAMSLTSVAIQANTPDPGQPTVDRATPCQAALRLRNPRNLNGDRHGDARSRRRVPW